MEQREKRIGEYLQADCGVGGIHVFRGLQEQMRLQGEGKYRLLGQVLIELGLVSSNQIEDALKKQSIDLVRLYSERPATRH